MSSEKAGSEVEAMAVSPERYEPSKFVTAYSDFLVRNACLTLLVVALSVGVMGYFAFKDGLTVDVRIEAFRVRFGDISDRYDAWYLAKNEYQFDPIGENNPNATAAAQSVPSFSLFMLMRNLDHDLVLTDVDNFLEEEYLEFMREVEETIFAVPDYDKYCLKTPPSTECDKPFSITRAAYSTLIDVGGNVTIANPDGNNDDIVDINEYVIDPLLNNAQYEPLRTSLLSKNFNGDNPTTNVLLSVVSFALPLEGYDSIYDRTEEQRQKFLSWGYNDLQAALDPYGDDEELGFRFAYAGDGCSQAIIDEFLFSDAAWAGGSVFFVFFYVWFHTKSLFLTGLGMTHVLMSLPLTLFIYQYILGWGYISVINFLGLFVILGIGADDIFVMLDAWKQAAWVENGDVSGPIQRRLSYTLSRSISAMTLTSISTIAAFLANLFSDIIPVRGMGAFTALLVASNFALVCIWFPAAIVLHERAMRYGWFSLCCGRRSTYKAKAVAAGKVSMASIKSSIGGAASSRARPAERFFAGPMADFLFNYRRAIVACIVALLIVLGVFALQFEPSSDWDMVDDNAIILYTLDSMESEFSVVSYPTLMFIVYGVDSVNRDDIDPDNADSRGSLILETDLEKWNPDMSEEAQEHFVAVCESIKAGVIDAQLPGEVNCPVQLMHEWRNASGLLPVIPAGADFQDAMKDWAYNYTGGEPIPEPRGDLFSRTTGVITNLVGFDLETEDLVYITIGVNCTLDNVPTLWPGYIEAMDEWMAEMNEDAPAGVQGYHTSYLWQTRATEQNMVITAWSAIVLSLIAALIIISIANGSFVMGLLTTVTVASVVVTTIGILTIAGFFLTVIESLAMTILVGISVDYVIHLSHAYMAATGTREERGRAALRDLGISVTASALTSLGSAAFLLPTRIVLFWKFGAFLMTTLGSSIFFSFFMFFPLVFIFGPEKIVERADKSDDAGAHGQSPMVVAQEPDEDSVKKEADHKAEMVAAAAAVTSADDVVIDEAGSSSSDRTPTPPDQEDENKSVQDPASVDGASPYATLEDESTTVAASGQVEENESEQGETGSPAEEEPTSNAADEGEAEAEAEAEAVTDDGTTTLADHDAGEPISPEPVESSSTFDNDGEGPSSGEPQPNSGSATPTSPTEDSQSPTSPSDTTSSS